MIKWTGDATVVFPKVQSHSSLFSWRYSVPLVNHKVNPSLLESSLPPYPSSSQSPHLPRQITPLPSVVTCPSPLPSQLLTRFYPRLFPLTSLFWANPIPSPPLPSPPLSSFARPPLLCAMRFWRESVPALKHLLTNLTDRCQ